MIEPFTESVVEEAALGWLESIGWRVAHDPDIAPDMPAAERQNYGDVVRDFIVFKDDGGGRFVKKMEGYHQFHAVRVAVEETLRAA